MSKWGWNALELRCGVHEIVSVRSCVLSDGSRPNHVSGAPDRVSAASHHLEFLGPPNLRFNDCLERLSFSDACCPRCMGKSDVRSLFSVKYADKRRILCVSLT